MIALGMAAVPTQVLRGGDRAGGCVERPSSRTTHDDPGRIQSVSGLVFPEWRDRFTAPTPISLGARRRGEHHLPKFDGLYLCQSTYRRLRLREHIQPSCQEQLPYRQPNRLGTQVAVPAVLRTCALDVGSESNSDLPLPVKILVKPELACEHALNTYILCH
jgi:hypothetical protein